MFVAVPATPENPKTPATIAMIKKVSAQLNIRNSSSALLLKNCTFNLVEADFVPTREVAKILCIYTTTQH